MTKTTTSVNSLLSTLLFSLILLGWAPKATAQYCTNNLHQNQCGANGNGFLDTLYEVTSGFAPVLRKTCSNVNAYQPYLGANDDVLTITQGDFLRFKFRALGAINISAWIDYNQNQAFEASEWIDFTRGIVANRTDSANFFIPFSALTGNTRMRIRTRGTPSVNGAGDACTRFLSGLTYDFNVSIQAGPICNGVPPTPSIFSNKDAICTGDSATITMQTPVRAGQFGFKWFRSNDGVNFTAIPNSDRLAINVSHASMQRDTVYLRVHQYCGATGDSAISPVIYLRKELPSLCFCITNLHNNVCDIPGYMIDSVRISNTPFAPVSPTVCNGTYYKYFDTPGDLAILEQGATFNLNYRSPGGVSVSGWIDYNGNGRFESSEYIDLGRNSQQGALVNTSFFVPGSAVTGRVGMRLRIRGAGAANGANDACLQFQSGFTMDYWADIYPGAACQIGPLNADIIQPRTSVCGYDSTAITLANPPAGAGSEIIWEVSTDGVNFTQDPTYTGPRCFISAYRMAADSVYVRANVTCQLTAQSIYSQVYKIVKLPIERCYCTNMQQATNCPAWISFVQIQTTSLRATFARCPGTNGGPYIRFNDVDTTTAILARGRTYVLNFRNSVGQQNGSAWIDANQDGLYSANEWYDLGRNLQANTLGRVNIPIPNTAKLGRTYLRIRTRASNGQNQGGDACTLFGSGITYEFPITISLTPVGLADALPGQLFSLYPNPSNGTVYLKLADADQQGSLQIIDAVGRVISHDKLDRLTTAVDAGVLSLNQQLAPGIYTLKLVTNEGTSTQRLVVE